ncbi:uncharacterized protein IUM83_13306 [Phytophthora cinnamomi]|uniref:uncharacterized protein n=1 Tax=Phytophthora cinnamomi TaxID=4785 RepID=UPI00355957CD|nr:hypothetical protein IUM83_13306 [Phytophthora cinnamomi]
MRGYREVPRLAMTAIMDPSQRSEIHRVERQKALDLIFDTKTSTIWMPALEIVKAQNVVANAYDAPTISRSQIHSLLTGSRAVIEGSDQVDAQAPLSSVV